MSLRSAIPGALALALLVPPALALAQAKAKSTPNPAATAGPSRAATGGDSIATLLGRPITRADLGATPPMLEQAAQGDTVKLLAMTTAWESQALTGLVLGALLDRYAMEQKIEATPAEVSEMMAMAIRVAETPEAVKAGAPRPDTTHVQVRKAGAVVVQRFKMHAALHKQYGGRVLVDPQAGPMPYDAYKSFLEAEHKAGSFTVSAEWTPRFWAAFTGDEGKQFVPAEEASEVINKAWWREGP